MSSALKSPLRAHVEYLHRPEFPETTALRELAVVALLAPTTTSDGLDIPAGAKGTIVAVWGDGAAYDVEFTEPAGVAAVRAADIKPL